MEFVPPLVRECLMIRRFQQIVLGSVPRHLHSLEQEHQIGSGHKWSTVHFYANPTLLLYSEGLPRLTSTGGPPLFYRFRLPLPDSRKFHSSDKLMVPFKLFTHIRNEFFYLFNPSLRSIPFHAPDTHIVEG